MFKLDVDTLFFIVKVDLENDKEVLAVRDVRISLHKEQNADDTASGDELGCHQRMRQMRCQRMSKLEGNIKGGLLHHQFQMSLFLLYLPSQILNLNLLPRQVAPLDWHPYCKSMPLVRRRLTLLVPLLYS